MYVFVVSWLMRVVYFSYIMQIWIVLNISSANFQNLISSLVLVKVQAPAIDDV